jgi:RES domain
MSAAFPPAGLARLRLTLTPIRTGSIFRRIYFKRHSEPLGYRKTPSRFSDPRRRVEQNRFGVLYLGESVAVCFLEAVLRDRKNGAIGSFPISERELRDRRCAEIEVSEPFKWSNCGAMRWSAWEFRLTYPDHHATRCPGAGPWHFMSIRRHRMASCTPPGSTAKTNIAVYDRAIPKLRARRAVPCL